jgi:hypothetical protein
MTGLNLRQTRADLSPMASAQTKHAAQISGPGWRVALAAPTPEVRRLGEQLHARRQEVVAETVARSAETGVALKRGHRGALPADR